MDDALLLDHAPAAAATVVLPVGYTDAQGQTHREAALRKLRGSDEALFYDTSLSGAQLVTELLRSCVTRLGSVAALQPAHFEQLYSADRNFLLFALRRVTFGDAWQAVYGCPACEAAVRVTEDLSTFPVRSLDDGERVEDVVLDLEDGYQDRTGATHRHLVVRLPRGHDEAFVARLAETDLWQARDALLVRCIQQFGSMPRAALESFGVKIVRDLTLGDRRRIQRALDEATPGVDFRRPVRCAGCGLDFDAIADVTDFFGVS